MAGRLPESDVPRDPAFQLSTLPARAAVGAAGFACVGLLAAGFLGGAPVWLRLVVAMGGLVVAPALSLAPAWEQALDTPRGRLAVVLPACVVSVLSLHALIAGLFTLLHLPFSLYASCTVWLALAWNAAACALAMRARTRTRAGRGTRALVLAGLLLVVAASLPPRYLGVEDAYDHIGHVRRIIALNAMRPDGVLAMPADATAALAPDPRKGAFHDLVAVHADLARADPLDAWGMLRVLMYPLAVLAFAGFSLAFVRGAAFAACLSLFLLSYPGTTLQLVNTAAYGQSLAAVWYWVIAALVLRGFGARGKSVAVLAALACGGVLVHLGVALHAGLLALSLVAFAPWMGLSRDAAIRAGAALVAGVALAVVVRGTGAHGGAHANAIHAHVHGVMMVTRDLLVVSPMEILRQFGLVFLGGLVMLPLTLLAARRDARARAVIALSVIPVLLAFLPPLSTFVFQRASYMSLRALLNLPVFAGLVVTVSWLARAARARGAAARVAAAVFLLAMALRFLSPSLLAFAGDLRGEVLARPSRPPANPLDRVVSGLPVGATVLSDPVTAYRFSALSSHRFVAILEQHANPRDPFALERLAAVRDVLSPYVIPQAAVSACRRFGVDFVVLSAQPWGVQAPYLTPGDPSLYAGSRARLQSMRDSFREFARGDDYVVLAFDSVTAPNNEFSGVAAPVRAERAAVAACRVPVPADRFEITGVGISPSVAAPGDSLDIVFGCRRDRTLAYGPGVVYHVRFDHESLVREASFPGDKYLRRARERTGAGLLRFRVDLRAGHGVYEPDLWPLGTPLVERFRAAIPPGVRPGRYRVEVRAVEETLLPNFDIRDLIFNRDHYAGVPCATIEVRAGGTAR